MAFRVLMVAYHFPPVRVSSGIQRTLSFCRYLPSQGWDPVVLTVRPRAYVAVSDDQMADIPPQVAVRRVGALDTARHLAIGGRYLNWLALPDRWASWWPGAVLAGLRMVRRYRPSVLWSTYPIATAHLIGLTLHRLTGLPWVADFRDPMVSGGFPEEPSRRWAHNWVEGRSVQRCTRAVVTTPGAMRLFQERYPDIPSDRWVVIENGYDESAFADAELALPVNPVHPTVTPIRIVHSGTLYPRERDPRQLFAALATLKAAGKLSGDTARVTLRATGHDSVFAPMLRELGLEDIVELAPGLPYREALREMLSADILLLLQAANCNEQIPAKAYEYLRARRPILALTDPLGDTGRLLRSAGVADIVRLDDTQAIASTLSALLDPERRAQAMRALPGQVESYSRKARSAELARLLDAALAIEGAPVVGPAGRTRR